MNKIILLVIGIVIIAVLGGLLLFKGELKPVQYETSTEYQSTQAESTEYVYKISGIGFKKEAWAEYKMEGYGWRIEGGTEKPLIGKILVKLISLPIRGKEYFGIEIDGLEDSPFEGMIFAMLFEKEGQGNYYLVKMKRAPTLCLSEPLFSGYEDIPEYFDRKSVEQEYKVDLSTWKFVGEENITLESGKEIRVFKFKLETLMEETPVIRDLWLSNQVPTYLVLNRETIGTASRSITLTNFGMDGGLPNFTDDDLKACG